MFGMRALRRRGRDPANLYQILQPDYNDIERHLAQDVDAEALSLVSAQPVTDMSERVPHCSADLSAHVFDDAEHGHVDAAKHGNAAPRRVDRASCWGVATSLLTCSGTCRAIVSCASPVPGRVSPDHNIECAPLHSRSICVKTDITISSHTKSSCWLIFDEEADRHHRHAEPLDRP